STQQTILQFQPFQLANASLRAQIDALGLNQLGKQFGEHFTALGQTERGKLHHQPTVVAIDGHSGEAVALAEDQPARLIWTIQFQNGAAQEQGCLQAGAEKLSVERLVRGPRIEPNANLAAAVVESARDKLTAVRVEINLRTVFRLARNGGDRAGVDPR